MSMIICWMRTATNTGFKRQNNRKIPRLRKRGIYLLLKVVQFFDGKDIEKLDSIYLLSAHIDGYSSRFGTGGQHVFPMSV